MRKKTWLPLTLLLAAGCAVQPEQSSLLKVPSAAEIVETSKAADWRPLDPENTLYLTLATGRVILELAPAFAPNHVANIKALARETYFDGLAVVREQDNYVAQWGDPAADEAHQRPIKTARKALGPEFTRPFKDLAFTPLPDGDVYAPEVGFAGDFPAARDPKSGRAWLTHCYGALGVGRGETVDSGSGAELYVVIGNAPRHLDRNITLVGRAVQGMELLSALPRGKGQLGFYTDPKQYVPIKAIRVAADLPPSERIPLEILRTDTPTFAAYVEARRNRRESFFVEPAGHIDVCNVPLPVREVGR